MERFLSERFISRVGGWPAVACLIAQIDTVIIQCRAWVHGGRVAGTLYTAMECDRSPLLD